ncbi:hypothetical protein BABINDRAFT_34125 [Babjeviella inositovora NRRL Y-12698]|uniref:OPT family small oligopeptide transporter n=1 Tax=Babjeviella inositovora NRRL Y-12698 TaxID=984486 RepID=A0A1E3QTT9_9ASCO|nr:uncharacterized protein BABINDRAFT_34125 [Babjeviella inositovora NRRL Y-12698]ODQ80964.1 hypothetical protein BABINDRAFT_34125 [Babjeviella inositovora NRRL Y-12698]
MGFFSKLNFKDAPLSETSHIKAENEIPEELKLQAVKSGELDMLSAQLSQQIMEDEYAGVVIDDDSPYPEVRAAVSSSDDPSVPQNTLRMWVIGMLMSTIGCALNMFFSLHAPAFQITTMVTSIVAWPMGRAWEYLMPQMKVFGMELNPGPFNIKEHAFITIMANVSFGGGAAYATDIILAMNNYYHKNFGWGFNLLAIWATQCIGFSMAGLCRRVLVESPSAIWPQNLVTCTFLSNIHSNINHPANGWKISRLRFFLIIFLCSFVWYWFPAFIFQALSYFAWVTWIKPNNVIVNQVFGASTGLGLLPITFDWNQIAGYIGSPLVPPVSVIFTILFAMVSIYWVATPVLHYKNVWYGKYLPMSDSGSYDRFQQPYNVSRIVDENLNFNPKAYKEYSPLFLSTTFAVSYGLSFAAMTATIVHTGLFHGKDIWNQMTGSKNQASDVHQRLMKAYKPVPEWWYAIVFLVFFGMSIAVVRAWPTEMPVYSLVLALLIAFFFLMPVGVIFALTNIAVGLNVITEFIVGYMVPGKPVAMMFFKTFGYITNNQAITFAQDMKLGHYMKLEPRLLFWAQFIATIWGSLVQICVLKWAQGAINGLCDAHQKNHFTCPTGKVFFNASVIWGVIGPERQFSSGEIYNGLLHFFWIGALLPIINWVILRRWPGSPVKYIHWPVFFSATGYIPPATPYNYGSYCIVGIVFGYFIKKRFFHWWTKYNYSLSAGLDIGLAWASWLIFLSLYLTNANAPNWWGNNVITETMDYQGTALNRVLADGESFGPSTWSS